MHLLVRETISLDEAAPAVELGLAPADILFLSFSEADLGGLAALNLPKPTLTLVNLASLRHPMSVDLFLEQTVSGSHCVVVRLLGGLDYWRYGCDELFACCRRDSIPLAILPGDGGADPALRAISTVPADSYDRLDACFRQGGQANLRRAVALTRHLADPTLPDDGAMAAEMPSCGVLSLDLQGAKLGVIICYRSHVAAEDIAPIIALAAALRVRGMAVGVIFAASLKAPDCADFVAATLAAWRPAVVLNATGFSARQDGASPLDAAGAPVLQLVLSGSSRAAWEASSRGLSPTDLAMQVVLPELDGRLLTGAISFKAPHPHHPDRLVHAANADGIALAADRAAGWAKLATTPCADRRIVVMLSDYPGIGGQRGHAVGLDSFASLEAVVRMLGDAGYSAAPVTTAQVVRDLCDADPTAFMKLDDYLPLFGALPQSLQQAVLTRWGAPCLDADVQKDAFTTRQCRLGHIFAIVQPDRGDAAERRTLYHDADTPPRHGYIALHLWLRGWADALVQLGAHGSLEWLPGKAAALSATCWPRVLSGGLPVIYPFIVNNPGEAAPAKRRLGAVTIGHLTPPLRPAGLHGAAAGLERLIDEYAAADGLDRRRTTALRGRILEQADAAGLLAESGVAPDAPENDALARLDAYLCDVKDLSIRDGLHVFATAPDPDRRAMLADVLGADAVDLCAPSEAAALLAALDGKFVQPGPAGAPSASRSDVLPTGRNIASIDPRAVPAPGAIPLAEAAATALLARHRQDHGDWPRHVVVNLWGTATMRTGGEDFALALVLLGARPVWDGGTGRVNGFEILPLAVLDRPRIDVTLRISGLFRDAFATQIELFNQVTAALAVRDEAPDWNPLAGQPTSRVFGPPPGRFGAGIGTDWSDRGALGRAWLAASSGDYGGNGASDTAALSDRVRSADAFVHVQDHAGTDLLDSPDHAAHLGGFAAAAAGLGATPALYHVDEAPRLLAEQIARVVRGRAANPIWLAGMRRHGYRGAAEIARTATVLSGYAATLPDRLDRQFDLLHEATLGDAEMSAFIRQANPAAHAAMIDAFETARRQGLWHPRRNAVAA